MKIIFLLVAIVTGSLAIAQSNSFSKIEDDINEHINRGQWDEIQLLATDLLIEEPTRGEGYYYTSLSFYKLGQYQEAGEYLEQAATLADAGLKKKIEQLKNEIAAGKEETKLIKSARDQQKNGNTEEAAKAFKQIWEKDKTNITPALNAVEIYIERKEFREALAILNDPSLVKDAGAQNLISRLNQTPQMQKANGYMDAMKQGNAHKNARNYSSAIAMYDKALDFKPGDAQATLLKREAQDEMAWGTARKNHTIEGYEAYISGSTMRQYMDEAIKYIREGLIYHGDKHAKENNLELMESFLFKYRNKYSGGPEDDKVVNILCTTYLDNAKKSATEKTAYSQGKAIEFYQATEKYCPSKYSLDDDIKLAKRKQLRYGRPNRGYLSYVYDSLAPIGISLGSVNNKKLGLYITGNINEAIFTKTAIYTVDNAGNTEGAVWTDVRSKNIEKIGYGDFILGFTKKITYPLWIYAGGGVSMKTVFWQMDTYRDDGTLYETEWAKNTDESTITPLADAGLILNLKALHLRAGVKSGDFKTIRYTAGIGFSWK